MKSDHEPDEAEEAGNEEEEAKKPKGATVPRGPSQQEVKEHMLTHMPFRSWCQHCVKGKAKGKGKAWIWKERERTRGLRPQPEGRTV